MIMNYNKWFHDQHKYLTGIRDGVKTFNDTKWVNIAKRYKILNDLNSELLQQQPFGVMGNKYGFDKLIDLMNRSNYSFEDINDSLIETYKVSYKNSMSRMLVNTQAVMFHTNNLDKKNVVSDAFTHYWIIDAPFNQLHFGDRDEFIRQRLHDMHTTEGNKYIPIYDFINSKITKLLGFTIICTVNGYICNDCMVAVDDKGFKFKVGWIYSSDVDFIIYKLDECMIYDYEVDASKIKNKDRLTLSDLGLTNNTQINLNKPWKCLVNIYDKYFVKTSPSVPNFGTLSNNGLIIHNMQQKTIDDITRMASEKVRIVIYGLKYIHELPNTYPATNYYDIIDTRKVYVNEDERVKDVNGKFILVTETNNKNKLEKCTPPIVLDRPITNSFRTIVDCLSIYDNLMGLSNDISRIGTALTNSSDIKSNSPSLYVNNIVKPLKDVILPVMNQCYVSYLKGAILTSLVSSKNIDRFKTFIDSLTQLSNTSYAEGQSNEVYVEELYNDKLYYDFVIEITKPFMDKTLTNFRNIYRISNNYFVEENYTRFNRPISEQCFITLKYNNTDGCWLFDYPKIEHFKGIGNSFYIDENLDGDELFKFFVLYTDTENPSETEVDELNLDQVFDFDLFCNEVDKHIGYIRYWYAENKLMKLCEILYDKYDGETCVQLLSKILKKKVDGKDILNEYPTDINYEMSNITSDNWDNYDEYSERSPFAINFMFYTLSMLNDNKDKMQSYFYNLLTKRLYNNRYIDIDISNIIDRTFSVPMNYSWYCISPFGVDVNNSSLISNNICRTFNGIPFVVNNNSTIPSTPYRYVFNVYDHGNKYSLLTDTGCNDSEYLMYDNPSEYGYVKCSYRDDIHIAKLVTFYLTYAKTYISEIQTDYIHPYDMTFVINSSLETLRKMIDQIKEYSEKEDVIFNMYDTETIVDTICNIGSNPLFETLTRIKGSIESINNCRYNNSNKSIITIINDLLKTMKNVYVVSGFDNNALKRARKMYLHLKRINTRMNVYEYEQWLNELDLEFLNKLEYVQTPNENRNYSIYEFKSYYNILKNYKDKAIPSLNILRTYMNQLSSDGVKTHIESLESYCIDIINNYIYDLYVIDEIDFSTWTCNTIPEWVMIKITNGNDNHYHPSVGDNILTYPSEMIFKPIYEKSGNIYEIKSLTKICEYTFFSSSNVTLTMTAYDNTKSSIGTCECTITFKKIGTTADMVNTFNQIVNIENTPLEFENHHEEYEIDSNGYIINKKFDNMNYELLIGNKFMQLDHVPEFILQPKTWLQGSVDKLYLSNQKINDLLTDEYSNHSDMEVYFKPVQVLHPSESVSVGGKYFVGQTLYAITYDNQYVFPIIVTSIDHAINKGFIEAKVDSKNAKWFNISDKNKIEEYFSNPIECRVTDDNIRNFLDEFNNPEYQSYYRVNFNNHLDIDNNDYEDMYSLPGDPIFVSNNTEYVYTRLNYFFNDEIPNRYFNNTETHRFIYIGHDCIKNNDDYITIKMVNHSFNKLSDPELYPILREEPNDHNIWNEEIRVFNKQKERGEVMVKYHNDRKASYFDQLQKSKTDYERLSNQIKYDEEVLHYNKWVDFVDRIDHYLTQLEYPTTWYNVCSYEAAMVYINNGRAYISPTFIPNIKDLPYTEKLNVFLYDWEHKHWISPDKYNIEVEIVDNIQLDNHDDYTTNNVLYNINIYPVINENEEYEFSDKILIYFSYDTSDVFDKIEMNYYTFNVLFKPILSLNKEITDYDPYHDINIRKHFDGNETYTFDEYSDINDFDKNGFLVKRVKRSGKYAYSPTFRLCDMSVVNGDNTHDYTDFDMYIRNPFKDTVSDSKYFIPQYTCNIIQPIENFNTTNETIQLICISNNDLSVYDGNISNIMFEGFINQDKTITITKSTLPNFVSGRFVCTVFQRSEYKPYGGLCVITITNNISTSEQIKSWIKIPDGDMYREIPNECIFVPKISIDTTKQINISFSNKYIKTHDDDINVTNDNLNPFEYYINNLSDIRYPISDTRHNEYKNRLMIDKSINENVKTVKSTYIGICRYSLQRIPNDGVIDVTGYIPTPLSRDRYEVWVNGRYVNNTSDLKILSPTSLQLCNMKSLKNFELIELVDDVNTSDIMREGTVYVDLNGNTFSTYPLALLSKSNIIQQDIHFIFNTNNHTKLQDYTKDIIINPNNHDIEQDILDTINMETEENDYNKYYNLPTINGITLLHPHTKNLGMVETPISEIVKIFDKVWSKEITTNPLFINTHNVNIRDNKLSLHIKKDSHSDSFIIYATGISDEYFTLYISSNSDGVIDDTNSTVKIIPFIRTGIYVMLSHDCKGLWLHSTNQNTKPIKIQ